MQFDVNFMLVALREALRFTPVTLFLACVPFILGNIFGLIIALIRIFHVKVLARFFQGCTVLVKSIPIVLLILMTNFLFVQNFDILAVQFNLPFRSKDVSPIFIALFPLTLYATVNLSEALRGALLSVDKGQYEAGYAVGMTRIQTLKRIVIPQSILVAIPTLCNGFIGLIKGSSLAFMISVTDLLNGALITATGNYNFLEAYIAAALVYWGICVLIERMSNYLENHLSIFKTGSNSRA